MVPTRQALLDAARVRVIASNAPSLKQLMERMGDSTGLELVGTVVPSR